LNSTEITNALAPLTNTGRVTIEGMAAYTLILLIDGTDELQVNIPFTATEATLLDILTTNYPVLAEILE